MRNAYTSIFLVSVAIAGLLKEKGIKPDVVAGFNQGEYAALCAAGGWQLPDGLYLLNKFATFYQEFLDGITMEAMRIIGPSTEIIEEICIKINKRSKEKVYVALYETKEQHTVAGYTSAVEKVRTLLSEQHNQKIKLTSEDVAIGLHSPLMNSVIERYKMYLEKTDFHDLEVCMLESLTGECIERGTKTKERVIERISSPVVWPRVMESLMPYELIVQVGPSNILATWAANVYPHKKIIAINKPEDLQALELLMHQAI
jgi:malonyl CoA-acyl carrier protein transacylase